MAISTRPLDKFAFLFAGKQTDQYIADLRKVLETLIYWYGYMPENIYVRVSFPVTALTDSVFATSGLNIDVITGADAGELRDSLGASIGALIDDAKIPDADIPAGKLNNTLFYFTGEGWQNSMTSLYELEIGTITSTPVYVTGIWLKSAIYGWDPTVFVPNSHIHIVLQQSKGYGMWQDAFDLITDTSLRLSFTAACNSGTSNSGTTAGSDFTDYWTKALQFFKRDVGGGVMKYADQEVAGSEPTDNHLISLNKAYQFAKSFTSATAPQYKTKLPAGDPEDQYLGLPSFWIRDGDEPLPSETSDYWWESKDIFLTHPPDLTHDDIYHPDEVNKVHVIIRNNGSHPVREFYTGTMIFLSGGGGVGDSTAFIHTVILKPGEFYEHIYDYDFTGTEVHRCIRSRAGLAEITAEQMDQDGTDDIAWAIEDNSYEAQRNLDKQPDAGKSSSGTGAGAAVPDPGEGKANEADPETEAQPPADENGNNTQPEGTTESQTTKNLRNFREHNIYVRNIFKRKRRFILAFPEDFKKALKFSRIEWCEKDTKKGKYRILRPLDGIQPYLVFDLKPGEVKELVLYTSQRPGKRQDFSIKVPFEILVETASLKDEIVKLYRGKVRKSDIPDQMPFSGITVQLYKAEGGTLHGTVYNEKKKPVPGAFVFISSGDRNQSAVMKTDKSGSYCVKDINPDNYIIKVRTRDWKSFEKVIHLGEGKTERVDFFYNEKQKKAIRKKVEK